MPVQTPLSPSDILLLIILGVISDDSPEVLHLLYLLVGLINNVYRHVFEHHIKQHTPLQCFCGHVRWTEKGLLRHQRKTGYHGPFLNDLPDVTLDKFMRKAFQSNCAKVRLEATKNAKQN